MTVTGETELRQALTTYRTFMSYPAPSSGPDCDIVQWAQFTEMRRNAAVRFAVDCSARLPALLDELDRLRAGEMTREEATRVMR